MKLLSLSLIIYLPRLVFASPPEPIDSMVERYQKLNPPQDVEIGDQFGFATALSGSTLAVGTGHGAVYIFEWTPLVVEVEKRPPMVHVEHGRCRNLNLRCRSDSNIFQKQDKNRAMANHSATPGANATTMPNHSATPGVNASASSSPSGWILQQKLTKSGQFGYALAMEGDTLVVGAPSSGVCLVYIYTRGESSSEQHWIFDQELLPSGYSQNFGSSVALKGNTLVAAAPDATPHDAVYIFERISIADSTSVPSFLATKVSKSGNGNNNASTPTSTTWVPTAKLTRWDTEDTFSNYFGASIALQSENKLVVSHSGDAAYVYERNNSRGHWVPARKVDPADSTDPYDTGYANSVAWADTGQLLIGAPFNGGSVSSFSGDGRAFHQLISSGFPSLPDYQFGGSLVAEGDILVANGWYAPGLFGPRGEPHFAQGSAIIHHWYKNAWHKVGNFTGDSNGDMLGVMESSMSMDGNWIAVGATQSYDDGGHPKGKGYVLVLRRRPGYYPERNEHLYNTTEPTVSPSFSEEYLPSVDNSSDSSFPIVDDSSDNSFSIDSSNTSLDFDEEDFWSGASSRAMNLWVALAQSLLLLFVPSLLP